MKKIFLIAALGLTVHYSFAQQNKAAGTQSPPQMEQMYPGHTLLKPEDVPTVIRSSWNQDYSAIKGAEWYREGDDYVVYYLHKKLHAKILYDVTGNQVSHSREVESEDVPAAIREFMKNKYPGIQYGRTYLSYTNGEDDKRYYEVQVDGNTWERFDINGNNIGK